MTKPAVTLITILLVLSLIFLCATIIPPIQRVRTTAHIERDWEVILEAFNTFYTEFGTIPTGSTKEIAEASAEANARDITFIDPTIIQKLSDGTFADPWGTPYQISSIDGELSLRSAGRDREFLNDSPKSNQDIRRSIQLIPKSTISPTRP